MLEIEIPFMIYFIFELAPCFDFFIRFLYSLFLVFEANVSKGSSKNYLFLDPFL